MTPTAETWESVLRQYTGVYQKRVKSCKGRTTRTLLIARNTMVTHRTLPTSKRRNGNSDESKWPSGTMVGLRDGINDKTANKRRFGVQLDGPVILFEAQGRYKPISSQDESRLHQVWFVHKIRPKCKGDGQVTCPSQIEKTGKTRIRVLVNRFKHQEVSHEDTRPFPCADWTVELFDHTVVQHSLRETSCQTKKGGRSRKILREHEWSLHSLSSLCTSQKKKHSLLHKHTST